MIRAVLLGAITLGVGVFAMAQNTQEELERALGLTPDAATTEDGELEEELIETQKRTYQQHQAG